MKKPTVQARLQAIVDSLQDDIYAEIQKESDFLLFATGTIEVSYWDNLIAKTSLDKLIKDYITSTHDDTGDAMCLDLLASELERLAKRLRVKERNVRKKLGVKDDAES